MVTDATRAVTNCTACDAFLYRNPAFFSMRRYLSRIARWADGFEFAPDPVLDAIAGQAYQTLVEWMGPPAQSNVAWEVIRGHESAIHRDWISKKYVIVVGHWADQPTEYTLTITHEMCHVVTAGRKSLVRFPWVDEILAEMAAARYVIDRFGDDYIRQIHDSLASSGNVMSVGELKAFRRLPGLMGWGNRYPEGFAAGIWVHGLRLVECVGWENVWSLAKAPTWEAWLSSLPADAGQCARRVLQI